ncbi:MAG: hypothetical protein GY720_11775 [bacterium]|nr:hypothetical protein [bacterium]
MAVTPGELLRAVTTGWAEDADSDVVWAGEHEGRWGIRMAQQTRDFTTIWFDIGEITIGYEAYLLPPPRHNQAAVLEQCLKRNHRSWPAYIAADDRGELYVRGRVRVAHLTSDGIETAVGSVYQLVEVAFGPLLALGYVA